MIAQVVDTHGISARRCQQGARRADPAGRARYQYRFHRHLIFT
jgi:hypothetical protein